MAIGDIVDSTRAAGEAALVEVLTTAVDGKQRRAYAALQAVIDPVTGQPVSPGGAGSLASATAGKQTLKTATGTGVATIAAANTARDRFSFTNASAAACRVTEGATDPSATVGVYVSANGGTYIADTKDIVKVFPLSGNLDCSGYEVVV